MCYNHTCLDACHRHVSMSHTTFLSPLELDCCTNASSSSCVVERIALHRMLTHPVNCILPLTSAWKPLVTIIKTCHHGSKGSCRLCCHHPDFSFPLCIYFPCVSAISYKSFPTRCSRFMPPAIIFVARSAGFSFVSMCPVRHSSIATDSRAK